jgi:hypothetical protein
MPTRASGAHLTGRHTTEAVGPAVDAHDDLLRRPCGVLWHGPKAHAVAEIGCGADAAGPGRCVDQRLELSAGLRLAVV